MKELTKSVIKDLFLNTGVDEKYFSYYETELKRRHKAFREEYPYDENEDEEERAEDEKNEKACIECANDYIRYYVEEREKGHSHNWANCYALCCVSGFDEYELIHDVCDKFEDKGEKDRELTIHAKSINKDPLFVERFKNMVEWGNPDISEKTEEYCCAYHKCIKEGKSEIYAHAYAEAVNCDYTKECCVIYARANELALKHSPDTREAAWFGHEITEAVGRGCFLALRATSEKLKEIWQKDFFFSIICKEYEKEYHTTMPKEIIEEVKKELYK